MTIKQENERLNKGANPGESQFDFVQRKIKEAQSAVQTIGHSRALSTALTKLDEASHWVKHEQELQSNAANAAS